MIKLFILILFLFPKILLGFTVGDDGKISNYSEKSTSNLTIGDNSDVFLLKNAGLSNQDSTLNIPSGSELDKKKLKNRYSIYKNIMKILIAFFFFFAYLPPSKAVTTKMFKVLDTCARYRLKEIDAKESIEKLKLESNNS